MYLIELSFDSRCFCQCKRHFLNPPGTSFNISYILTSIFILVSTKQFKMFAWYTNHRMVGVHRMCTTNAWMLRRSNDNKLSSVTRFIEATCSLVRTLYRARPRNPITTCRRAPDWSIATQNWVKRNPLWGSSASRATENWVTPNPVLANP